MWTLTSFMRNRRLTGYTCVVLKEVGAGTSRNFCFFWLATLLDIGAHQFHLERGRALGASAPSLQARNDGIKDSCWSPKHPGSWGQHARKRARCVMCAHSFALFVRDATGSQALAACCRVPFVVSSTLSKLTLDISLAPTSLFPRCLWISPRSWKLLSNSGVT